MTRWIALCAVLSVACGSRAEQQILRGYFDTCAIADDVALANMAIVVLDPRRDGTVGHFRVTTTHPGAVEPAAANPRVVHLSLQDPGRSHDERHALLFTESLDVTAEIYRDGRATRQPMVVTLAQARTPETVGRWIVVRLALNGRSVPEASSGPR